MHRTEDNAVINDIDEEYLKAWDMQVHGMLLSEREVKQTMVLDMHISFLNQKKKKDWVDIHQGYLWTDGTIGDFELSGSEHRHHTF